METDMGSYQFQFFSNQFIHLWVQVSRLGGANRKGFNGGFRLHFDINFETDMDPYRFSYQF